MIKSFSSCDFMTELNVLIASFTKDPTRCILEAPGKGQAGVPADNHQNV